MFIDKKGYFEIDEFTKYGLRAIYTTKELGDFRTDEAREKAIDILNLKDKKIYSGFQTHSDNIQIIKKETENFIENCDGFITNLKDVVIFTKYADCLPIFFFDKKLEVFACVHSGWQGSYKEIGTKCIRLFQEEYGSDLNDIIVGFGIGISKENYEVQIDFYNKFLERFGDKLIESSFSFIDDKIYFDNQEFNYKLLSKNGVKNENFIRNNLCSFSDKRVHSYRRDKDLSGRNGSYIFIDKVLLK